MASVKLENIVKRWGDAVAVERMSLDIADGEFLVLLGPSGCGKTTTMRMVAGLEALSEGDVYIADRKVTDLEPKDRDVAMVFQSYGLYPNMTVYENISFPLRIRGTAKAEIHPAVMAAASQVELTDYLNRKPKELSGGQRQRVALARAIVRRPSVFLMDEPLSNLDAKLRVSMRAHIKHLHHSLKITTIYVTHDQIEAMTLADRVVVMSKAKIQQIGTPTSIYSDPNNLFVAGFIGSPAMNLLRGSLRDGVFTATAGADAGRMSVPGFGELTHDNIVLGVRAEDVNVLADLVDSSASVQGSVFACELTGEATLVTVKLGTNTLTARAGKDIRLTIGSPCSLGVSAEHCYLFDGDTELRIRR